MIFPIPGFSEPVSSISHLLSAGISFVASFFLVFRGRGNSNRVIGLLIYSFMLVYLFSMSGVYHLLEKGSSANFVLRILDYTGIYCLIAGSFTPLHLILFRGRHRWLVLAIVWTLAITGTVLTAIFFASIPDWLSLIFFLGLGWMGMVTVWNIYRIHSRRLIRYIVLGGVAYTVGAVLEFLNWPIIIPGVVEAHEIFHLFVMLGAFLHWKLIYLIAMYPISSKITIIVKEFPGNDFQAMATSEHISFKANSVAELKQQVMDWVKANYHKDMLPETINFKFFKEETIST